MLLLMVVNKISDDFVSDNDDNVKVGDVATITKVDNKYEYNVRLENPNWIIFQITKQNMFLMGITKGCETLTNGKIRVEKLMLG